MRVSGLVLAMLVGVTSGAGAGSVEVEVGGMGLDSVTGSPVVRLVEKGRARTGRQLPIWIGPLEAQAIALEMRGLPSPRPLTHDLMKQLVEGLGGKLERVVIEDLRDGTYFATVHVAGPESKQVAVDARPSDAIALALRLHAPILVAEELFGRAATAGRAPTADHLWGLTVQNLTPEVAAFFRVPAHQGVLVSDVAVAAPASELVRGDVITALDDQPVRSVGELTSRAGTRVADEPVRLSIRRDDHDLTITFTDQ